jgi:fibronectin-binding autotransporter adhesin
VGRLNYSGKFDAKLPIDGTGAHSHGHLHVDSVSAHALHAPAGAIIVPDAQLLFNADFKRSGLDLVLSNQDHELVLPDYFKGEKRAALSSPDGAHLTGDIVNALTGHQQFAQADGSASVAKVIGHVSKLAGAATAIRNGVSIILNNGDDVQKGDVVQAGSNSTLGITFIDGTVFGLSSNAKMVLNEMVYDPNGSSNSSLISLVAGTISFVAGETAKHGDMKVDTPVATMGIRGTAVLVEIDFDVPQSGAPSAKFQVLVEPDGHTGNYVLFDKVTLAPIATVDQAGVVKSLSQGILTSYSAPLSADVQKLITDVFSLKFTDNTNPNTKSFDHFTDTLLPQAFTPIKLADGATAVPIIVNVNTTSTALSSGAGGPADPHAHIPGPPLVVAVDGALIERIGVTHSSAIDTVTGTINFVDLNAGDTPTVTTKFDSFTYQNAQHQDVTATLNALQLADIAKVEAKLLLTPDPANNNNGSVTWNYTVVDSAFDFLAVGETLTLTYEARVDNNFGPNDEFALQKFTITITRGSNDVPVITTGPQTVPFSGGTTTPGGDLPATAPTSGTLAFTDVDLTDTHTVSAKLTSAVLPGVVIPPGPLAAFEAALSASIAADSTGSGSGTINWKLADLPVFLADFIPKGETLTLTYAVTVTDSQGATASQNIIVTITGTAAPAVVWVATTAPGSPPGGLWSDAANWETGTVPTLNDDVIIITDQLHGLTPSFPVTIKAPAFAKSVTMNDFGSSAPELINQSTLTISGVLSLAADSIVDNSGTISVGDLMEVLNTGVLQNSGLIMLANGGDFKDHSTISNTITGTIDVTGGTLNVQVDIANSGKVTVETNAKLTLGKLTAGSAAIDGGTVTNNGEIDLTGAAVLMNGSFGNSGQINVSGTGNALHKEKVTANHILEVLAGGALLLDLGTTLANASGNVTIDGAATLTLDSASIDGGAVTGKSNGVIDLAGNAVLKNGVLGNAGQINVSGSGNALDGETVTNTGGVFVDHTGVLTLDLGTSIAGGILTNSGLVQIEFAAGATLDGVHVNNGAGTIQIDTVSFDGKLIVDDGTTITGGSLTIGSLGLFEVKTGPTGPGATLDGVTVGNSGVVQVDTGAVLDLTGGTTITGGSVTGAGTIHVTGDSAIDGAKLDTSQITVDATKTLTLDGTTVTGTTITDHGTVKVDADDTLHLSGAHLTGGAVTVAAEALVQTGGSVTLSTNVTNDGTIEVHDGALKISGSIAGDGAVKIDGGAVFELDGSDTQNVDFAGAGGELKIDASTFDGKIVGLAVTDKLDLGAIGFGPHTTGTYVSDAANDGGVLTITDGSHSISLNLVGDYRDAHFAGGTDENGGTLITLNAADDVPAFAADEKTQGGTVTELTSTTGSSVHDPLPALSGSIDFTDIDLTDRPTATITAQTVKWTAADHSDLSASLNSSETSALEQALSLTKSGNTNNGAIGWTYSIADGALDFLAAGQTATITSTVTLDDHEGGTDTATVTITVTGTNDVPVLAADCSGTDGSNLHAVNELANKTGDSTDLDTASGTLAFTDADLSDTHVVSQGPPTYAWSGGTLTTAQTDALTAAATLTLSETDSTHTGKGSIGFSYSAADGNFDFLADGETLKVTYNVTVTDNHGISSTQPVTITLTGTNDAPALAADTLGANGLHGIIELADKTGDSSDLDTASGTLAFTDADLTDTHTVSQGPPSYVWSGGTLTTAQTDALTAAALKLSETDSTHTGKGSIGFSYSAADGTFDFLAANETLKVTYNVTVTDSHGVSSTQPVTITITGTNDAPSIGDPSSASVTEDTNVDHGNLVATGSIPIVDQDHDQSSFETAVTAAAGDLGSLSLNANGTYIYTVANAAAERLADGETKVDNFTVTSLDGTTKDVSFVIHGANDAPAITSSAQTGSITEISDMLGSTSLDTASGAVTFTDADLSDTHTVTVTGVTESGATSGLPDGSTLTSWLSLGPLTDSVNGATGSDAWSFSAQDKNFDYLGAGQKVTLDYTIQVADHHGGSTTQHVDITITGTNDAPTILSETNPATQAVIVLSPVTPIVLAPGVNTNSLGLNTETFDTSESPNGSSSDNGAGHGNFHSDALDADFSRSGNAGVVNGSSGVSAAPFVGPGVPDATNYLSVGAGGTETITFDDEQNAFGLYWGSVDSYNTISFYHGATLVASYTGADVTPLFPTGNQGSFSSNGYVEFAGLASFDKVVLTSSSNAFEIDNISAGSLPVPHVELAAPITGTLTVSDADIGDTLTASVIGNAVLKYNGLTTIPGNVDISKLVASNAIKFDSVKSDGGSDVLHWTYDPTNPNLDFLKSGDTLTITYAAQVSDGHGNIGSQPLTVTIAGTTTSANPSQSEVLNGTSQNDTFNSIGNNETIFGAGGHDTFVFKPGFGSATIGDFDVNNDTINIDHTLVDHGLVTSLSAFLATAQSANSGHDTILTDANHDTITLKGVTVAQVHQGDFHVI